MSDRLGTPRTNLPAPVEHLLNYAQRLSMALNKSKCLRVWDQEWVCIDTCFKKLQRFLIQLDGLGDLTTSARPLRCIPKGSCFREWFGETVGELLLEIKVMVIGQAVFSSTVWINTGQLFRLPHV